MSFIGSSLRHQSVAADPDVHGKIDLLDNTSTTGAGVAVRDEQLEDEDPQAGLEPMTKRSTNISLRDELAKRKYRKFQQSRYQTEVPAEDSTPASPSAPLAKAPTASTAVPVKTSTFESGTSTKARLKRGRDRLHSIFHRHTHRINEGDYAVDVLYQNERGMFIFGMPFFSSAALWNFDPPAWVDAFGQPSAVNTSNAQPPDPSWEWAWNTWYVDMSWDVDEQGWQYSFMFQNKFAWHGTHPWVHSFVRRRRWLRKRIRKTTKGSTDGMRDGSNRRVSTIRDTTSDYFVVIPEHSSQPQSPWSPLAAAGNITDHIDSDGFDTAENIQMLIHQMKQTQIDRVKINLVLRFLEQGGDEVAYLPRELHYILSLFLFQHSRRQLLSAIVTWMDERESGISNEGRQETSNAPNEAANLHKLKDAVHVADQGLRDLEYWSDIKTTVHEGKSDMKSDQEWLGIDESGPIQSSVTNEPP